MENVHHHVRIIRDHPVAQRKTIHRHRLDVVIFSQSFAQLSDDRLEMGLRRSGANDEKIREAGNAAEIDGDNVLGLFFGDEFCAAAGE